MMSFHVSVSVNRHLLSVTLDSLRAEKKKPSDLPYKKNYIGVINQNNQTTNLQT